MNEQDLLRNALKVLDRWVHEPYSSVNAADTIELVHMLRAYFASQNVQKKEHP